MHAYINFLEEIIQIPFNKLNTHQAKLKLLQGA